MKVISKNNVMKTKRIFIFLMLLSNLLCAQEKRFQTGFKLSGGLSGLDFKGLTIDESKQSVSKYLCPKESFSTGVYAKFIFNKRNKLYLVGELLLDYSTFARNEEWRRYNPLLDEVRLISRSVEETKLNSIFVPVRIGKDFNTMSINFGLVSTVTFFTEIIRTRNNSSRFEKIKTDFNPYKDNDKIGETYIEDWYKLQYSCEILYRLSQNVTLGMEYMNYFKDHLIKQWFLDTDVIYLRDYAVNANSLRVNLILKLK